MNDSENVGMHFRAAGDASPIDAPVSVSGEGAAAHGRATDQSQAQAATQPRRTATAMPVSARPRPAASFNESASPSRAEARAAASVGNAEEEEWPELPEVHKHYMGRDGHRADGRRRKKKKKSPARTVLTVLCVVLAVLIVGAGAAFAWWRHSVDQGEKAMTEEVVKQASTEDGVIDYNGKKYRLNENVVTVCFIGYDDTGEENTLKGGQSDAIMVLAFDTSTGKVKVISVPRDSMVTVDVYAGESYGGQVTEQLCLQYSYGDAANRSSELTANAVSRLFYNVPISYYYTLNIRGVSALNDSIGGVTLTALQTLPNSNIVEGQQITLLGKDARTYVQYRDTQSTIYTSLDRQERQKQYVKAFVSEVLEIAKTDPGKLIDLYNEASEFTYTNLGLSEYTYLVDTVLANGISEFEITSLDGEMQQGDIFAEFYLDKDALRQEIIDTFYTEVQ